MAAGMQAEVSAEIVAGAQRSSPEDGQAAHLVRPGSNVAVTQELIDWVGREVARGSDGNAMLGALLANNWDRQTAALAVNECLERVPASVAVPSIGHLGRRPVHLLEGQEVQILAAMSNPAVVMLANFLSPSECDHLMALAQPKMSRSTVVSDHDDGSELDHDRTSQGAFLARAATEVVARVERRIAALLDWPLELGEDLQVLRYAPGQEYKPHHDYFNPGALGSARTLQERGQRVGTLVMYLSTPTEGGGTLFPDAQLEIVPIRGNAVFFSYDRAHPMTKSLHGGQPVLAGEKWAATKWLREAPRAPYQASPPGMAGPSQ